MKFNHYVGIIGCNNEIKFVTDLDNRTRCASWKSGQPAKKFTKAAADDVAFGLAANGFPAAVVKMPSYYSPTNYEE